MSSRCHGFVILVARILDYFGFADAGLVFNLFMVIFMALGCNLEGIICQPAIWAQGELSVTRKALVLRVASGELAKHRPILDLGGAIGIFCVWWVSLYTVMIWWWWYILYIYICISNIILSLLCEISYVDGVLLWLVFFFGCFCVLYIYILIFYISSNLGLWEWTLRWLGSLTFPDTQTGDNACATGESPLLPAVLVSPNDITMSPAVQLGPRNPRFLTKNPA